MKELQQKVDQMIIHLGGYWRPLSGLARLLEEIGEVGGALYIGDEDALREELMDVFVISTCLANQYAIALDLQTTGQEEMTEERIYYRLVREAGEVGRILNAYEGDKKLKATATPGSLKRHLEAVQKAVGDLATLYDFDLYAHIGLLIEEKSSRDFGRFDHTRDPITEESVRTYLTHVNGRYWGGIHAKPSEAAYRYREREYNLDRYFKIAKIEGLDGFVIRQPLQPFVTTSSLAKEWGVPNSFTIDEEQYEGDQYFVIRQKR